jgi:hypothetical protein
MTATQRPGRAWAATALRRAIGALQSANDELLRANEAIFRPAGAPRASGPGAARVAPPAGAGAGQAARPAAPAKAGGGGAGQAA